MYLPILDLVENNAVDITDDSFMQALHLIITTLYLPKGSIPNLPDIGCSLYNYLSTLDMEKFNLQVFYSDLQTTGAYLGYSEEAIQLAQVLVETIDIQDKYLYVTYDSYNKPQYFTYDVLQELQPTNVKLVKTVTIKLNIGLELNVIIQ